MANLYTFEIERKNKNSKSKKKNKTKIVVVKPTVAESENGEFFYGQKFNEFINAGFSDRLQTLLLENVEAARIVQFYGEAKKLDKEQKEKLKNAQEDFVTTQKQIYEYQELMRDQYSQTADAKAEQRLIEWFVFNFSFYEDEIDGNKGLFPIFQGETFDDKREFYLSISEDKLSSNDSDTLKAKEIFEASFETLIRVVSVWFNKMGTDQESVDKALQDLFEEEEKEEKEEVKEESKDE